MRRLSVLLDDASAPPVHHPDEHRRADRGDAVDDPRHPRPFDGERVDVDEARGVCGAENDCEDCADGAQGSAFVQPRGDRLLVQQLREAEVGQELHRLERHEHARGREGEGGQVDEGSDDEYAHPRDPRPAAVRLPAHRRRTLQPQRLQVLTRVDQHGSSEPQQYADEEGEGGDALVASDGGDVRMAPSYSLSPVHLACLLRPAAKGTPKERRTAERRRKGKGEYREVRWGEGRGGERLGGGKWRGKRGRRGRAERGYGRYCRQD
mmetsp:Transcript_25710/g.62103  ORF Transcript_25710/g.62103 Transcript_25710/m.62103 type:complete len:265 (+) Transcript_25710:826-1620(+)